MSDDLIFGHTWQQIRDAQQGNSSALHEKVVYQPKPTATNADIALLAKHGKQQLLTMQFHGVLDRLTTSGLI